MNLHHISKLISNTIDLLDLDLTGFTVLTEAASGYYAVTPVIAAMAHADRVIALTSNSPYASVQEVISQTRALEQACGQNGRIEIHSKRSPDLFSQADIITNLGFVRPIDNDIIALLKPTAVIPYMCEGWEIRATDVDLNACWKKEIPVLGTNEEYPKLNILSYCGWLCIKMMMNAHIEPSHANILIVSGDKFGPVIVKLFKKLGLSAKLVVSLRGAFEMLLQSDVIIIADYTRDDEIIGSHGDISPEVLAHINPSISIIQFAGINNVEEILHNDIMIYPETKLQPHRMALTLSELGPRPVIELHTLGLKVGEVLARARKEKGLGMLETIQYAQDNSPGDLMEIWKVKK